MRSSFTAAPSNFQNKCGSVRRQTAPRHWAPASAAHGEEILLFHHLAKEAQQPRTHGVRSLSEHSALAPINRSEHLRRHNNDIDQCSGALRGPAGAAAAAAGRRCGSLFKGKRLYVRLKVARV